MASRGEVPMLFGQFLRARRAECRPEQVGLPPLGKPRRVTGLRREEVAQLSGVSVDYYIRLEQGRLPPPSLEVLDALGRALRLDVDQRAYMRELAARSHEPTGLELPSETVSSQTRAIVAAMTGSPAMVLGRAMDVLAWNPLAAALYLDFDAVRPSERNFVRLLFVNERIRSLYEDWSDAVRVAASIMRMRAARFPDDPRIRLIVDELCQLDDGFRRWWGSQQVITHSRRRRTYRHPVVGDLDLDWCELISSSQPEVTIVVLTPADARSGLALRRISSAVRPPAA